MRISAVEYIYRHAQEFPDKMAVITKNSQTTYADLWKFIVGYAWKLRKDGLNRGDIVITRARQSLEYVVTYFSVHLAGGVIASVEKNIPPENLVSVVQALGGRVIIGEKEDNDICGGCLPITSPDIGDQAQYGNIGQLEKKLTFPSEKDLADILFTTGTTGTSKGVELTHKALTATAENVICGCQYDRDTVLIVPGPLNHANAIRKLLASMVMGSTIYIVDGMANLPDFFRALDWPSNKMACCLPPAAIRVIFQMTKEKIGDYANKIDFIESASAPLPEPDKLHLCRLLPQTRLYNNYGSSESASVCMYDYHAYPDRPGCVGRAVSNARVFIVDDERKEILSSANHMGLVACAGDMNMRGYVGDPVATDEVMKDGVVYTNDVGYIDEDGFVYIVGRRGDVINVGGLKVSPAEVESAALGLEGVEDCICIPCRHAVSGQVPKLLVVMADGRELDKRKIRQYLLSKLESFKVPAEYEQVDSIARTYNGKLDRKAYVQ